MRKATRIFLMEIMEYEDPSMLANLKTHYTDISSCRKCKTLELTISSPKSSVFWLFLTIISFNLAWWMVAFYSAPSKSMIYFLEVTGWIIYRA